MATTPTAQPEAVVPEVLARCARLLGYTFIQPHLACVGGWLCGVIADDHEGKPMNTCTYRSAGDLLLEILNCAVEMGWWYELNQGACVFWKPYPKFVEFDHKSAIPIEAALLAFAQLERAHD